MNFYAIILAAGSGKRMGIKEKKQFLMIENKAIFMHSLLAFARLREIKKLILVYSEDDYQRYKILIDKEGLTDRVDLIPGGEERQQSVINGLEHLIKSSGENDYVLIHDGARPLISQKDILTLIDALKQEDCKGATLAYKISDTIKKVDKDGFIKKNIPRDSLWGIMTPQGFKLKTIYEAHKKATDSNLTDDTELLIQMGEQVKVVEGLKQNIKLTTQEDLKTIEMQFKSMKLKIESPF